MWGQDLSKKSAQEGEGALTIQVREGHVAQIGLGTESVATVTAQEDGLPCAHLARALGHKPTSVFKRYC